MVETFFNYKETKSISPDQIRIQRENLREEIHERNFMHVPRSESVTK